MLIALVAVATMAAPASAASGKSGTTLAAYKTIDVCEVSPATESAPAVWRYSGQIAAWNEGAVATLGLSIVDTIQQDLGSGFAGAFTCGLTDPVTEIAAGTTLLTATTFNYSCDGPAILGGIRNSAQLTILNHSGSVGTPKGPNPKATYVTLANAPATPTACVITLECGCTYSQGYWGNKPDVVWPDGYDRNATFFLSGLTWQEVLDAANAGGNGYFILAKQYIAAILNQANGSCVPDGIQATLDLATAWLDTHTQGTPKIGTGPSAIPATGCYVGGSCGDQKDWGAVLDDYIQGIYPGSPGHCTE